MVPDDIGTACGAIVAIAAGIIIVIIRHASDAYPIRSIIVIVEHVSTIVASKVIVFIARIANTIAILKCEFAIATLANISTTITRKCVVINACFAPMGIAIPYARYLIRSDENVASVACCESLRLASFAIKLIIGPGKHVIGGECFPTFGTLRCMLIKA